MSAELSVVQKSIIKDIALKEGFDNYELLVTSGSIKGDGFLGIIKRVTIKGDNRTLNLVLKSAHSSEKLRVHFPIVQAYGTEIFLYEKVFPAFNELQAEYKVLNGFSGYAKIYGSSKKENNECLILENLRESGYKLWNKKSPMNSEHIAAVFEVYGKLHASSLVMKIKKPEVYEQITERLKEVPFFNPDGNKQLWQHTSKGMTHIGMKAVEGNSSATEVMQRVLVNLDDFFRQTVNEDRIVILHGDCWNNNMMFKYEDTEDRVKPSKVCLLDWQLSRTGSPVLDLAYFFFVCSSKKDLVQYKKYLKIYHNSVVETLNSFSCDVETIFPFSLLEYHWKKYCKFGVLLSILLIKVMLSEEDEVPDLAEIAETNSTSKPSPSNFTDLVHFNECSQRITDIVTVISENELI